MKKFAKILSLSLALVLCIGLIVGCTPNSAEKAKQRFEDNDYLATIVISEDSNSETVAWSVTATGYTTVLGQKVPNILDTATITCYKNKDDAKKAFDALSTTADDCKFISGKIVVFGTNADIVNVVK